ncbi:MAG: DNA repair exonuclease [Chloroflexota bacterium]
MPIEPFRFLHTGDLHLDSPFVGLTAEAPPEVARALRDSTLRAWERIVKLALDEQVDFAVVAGDAFEHANRTLLAQVRFRDGLERLASAGIPSFVVTGNHDPLSGWEPTVRWPDAVHRFGAEAVQGRPVLREGREIARVYGISYPVRDVTENLALRFRREADAPYAVGVLHANVGGQPGHFPYSPCTLSDLRASGIEYWALGHVHRPAILSQADPTVVYCGNPQGRDPGETEPRGAYVVQVDGAGNAEPTFHATDVVRWHLLAVDIGEVDGEEALIEAVVAAVEAAQQAAARPIVARVTLVGRGPLHRSVNRGTLRDDVRQLAQERLPAGSQFAWLESLRDATRPIADPAGSSAPATFLGELSGESEAAREVLRRQVDTEPEDEESSAAAGWEEALDELYANARVRRVLRGRRPDRGRLVELLSEAERLAVDRMVESG